VMSSMDCDDDDTGDNVIGDGEGCVMGDPIATSVVHKNNAHHALCTLRIAICNTLLC